MADYSWIEPSTKNIANLFGLNPEAAAKGRAMQSEQEYNAARTANTQADTGLSDYRRRLLDAQAATQAAQAGKFGADTRYRDTETSGLAEQQRQLKIAQQFINDNFTMDASGRPVPKPGTLGQTMAAVVAAGGVKNISNSGQVIKDYSLIAAPSSRDANLLAGGANATAAAKPTFAGTDEQAKAITAQQQAAAQNQAVEVAKARSIAQNIGGAPRAVDLTRAANDAVKLGPTYLQNRYGSEDFPVPKDMVAAITSAAQERYPQLPINQAIDKVVEESKIQFAETGNWSPYANQTVPRVPDPEGWLPNKDADMSDLAKLLAGSAPSARAATPPTTAAPVAPAAQANDSFKGAPSERMISVPGQVAQPAPAQSGKPTKSQFIALPEGAPWVANGIKYIKRGGQLVPAQ